MVAVSWRKLFDYYLLIDKFLPVCAGLAVSTAIGLMMLTKSVHPPGGATALFAVIGSKQFIDLGYLYAIFPILTGSCIQICVGIFCNNLSDNDAKNYPVAWSPFDPRLFFSRFK